MSVFYWFVMARRASHHRQLIECKQSQKSAVPNVAMKEW